MNTMLASLRRAMAWLLLALAACLSVGPAQAVTGPTYCAPSMTSLVFGAVDPFSPNAVDVTATITYQCRTPTSSTLERPNVRIAICFGIGGGSQGTGSINPRDMINGSSSMQFQIYKLNDHAQPWGTLTDAQGWGPVRVSASYQAPNLGTTAVLNGTLTVYGRVTGNQNALSPGSYANSFSGANARLDFAANETTSILSTPTTPASCTSSATTRGGASFPFSATASVAAQCAPDFATQNIDFGTHSATSAPIDSSMSLLPKCTNGTNYQLGLNNGANASGTQRRMRNTGGQFINYELYRDSDRTLRWGNTAGTDTAPGTGNGSAQDVTVYARTPTQPLTPSGDYSDTVTVTITY